MMKRDETKPIVPQFEPGAVFMACAGGTAIQSIAERAFQTLKAGSLSLLPVVFYHPNSITFYWFLIRYYMILRFMIYD